MPNTLRKDMWNFLCKSAKRQFSLIFHLGKEVDEFTIGFGKLIPFLKDNDILAPFIWDITLFLHQAIPS